MKAENLQKANELYKHYKYIVALLETPEARKDILDPLMAGPVTSNQIHIIFRGIHRSDSSIFIDLEEQGIKYIKSLLEYEKERTLKELLSLCVS